MPRFYWVFIAVFSWIIPCLVSYRLYGAVSLGLVGAVATVLIPVGTYSLLLKVVAATTGRIKSSTNPFFALKSLVRRPPSLGYALAVLFGAGFLAVLTYTSMRALGSPAWAVNALPVLVVVLAIDSALVITPEGQLKEGSGADFLAAFIAAWAGLITFFLLVPFIFGAVYEVVLSGHLVTLLAIFCLLMFGFPFWNYISQTFSEKFGIEVFPPLRATYRIFKRRPEEPTKQHDQYE